MLTDSRKYKISLYNNKNRIEIKLNHLLWQKKHKAL